ncbi:MAG: gliding motility-associated C-terminal domain-containing protein [Chitinophagaceae bacterium]|nr:gliding motility-associated C-terminal domain-containing protein [Chitinophagaceae bacterium]
MAALIIVIKRLIRCCFTTLIALLISQAIHAQLCTGSLGDPVVSITFGSGNDNSGYAPTNAYSYTNSTCPNDGSYTITRSTANCFGNTWHTVNRDHTGNGAFMLVNASYTPGDFFVATVKDLCPNTDYEFAAWIMNVLNRDGIRPNITFTIEAPDGTVLQDFSTGDIPESSQAEWKQYGFYFTTPANNPVIILRMRNNAPGGLGNDLALDDITFRPCGPIIKSVIQGNTDTVHICKGNTNLYTITADASADYISPAFQWQISNDTGRTWRDIPGANSMSYLRQPTSVGLYEYRVAVTEQNAASILSCRIASNVVIIHVHDDPFTDAGPNRTVIAGDSLHLAGTVTGETPSYYWSPPTYLSDATDLNASLTPSASAKYTLYAESEFGCTNNDTMSVKVVAGIFVPSAFTPNNDGKNDRWHIPYLDPVFQATVNVYNRFGKLVYHAEGETVDWDGSLNGLPQPSATYIYLIRFKKGRPDMKGTVTIIR